MNFPEKLRRLRKSMGYTQKKLAAELNVSRQTVTKWESGLVSPDMESLIQLSNLMHVTVDYLVRRQNSWSKPMIISTKELAELLNFKLKATLTFCSSCKNKMKVMYCSTPDFRYEEGSYEYNNSYLGDITFAGEESVRRKGQAVYVMNYMGRILKNGFSAGFLKESLCNATPDMPFRGPKIYHSGDYVYKCKTLGNTSWFHGYEEIFYQNEKVYECFFHGGLLQ